MMMMCIKSISKTNFALSFLPEIPPQNPPRPMQHRNCVPCSTLPTVKSIRRVCSGERMTTAWIPECTVCFTLEKQTHKTTADLLILCDCGWVVLLISCCRGNCIWICRCLCGCTLCCRKCCGTVCYNDKLYKQRNKTITIPWSKMSERYKWNSIRQTANLDDFRTEYLQRTISRHQYSGGCQSG